MTSRTGVSRVGWSGQGAAGVLPAAAGPWIALARVAQELDIFNRQMLIQLCARVCAWKGWFCRLTLARVRGVLFNYPDVFLLSLRSAVRNKRSCSCVATSAIRAPWQLQGLVQPDARRSLTATEDTIPALFQENHVAQILIFYAKSRQKMNGIWQKDIPSELPRDCCLAESWWLFPGCGMVVCGGGGRFPLA